MPFPYAWTMPARTGMTTTAQPRVPCSEPSSVSGDVADGVSGRFLSATLIGSRAGSKPFFAAGHHDLFRAGDEGAGDAGEVALGRAGQAQALRGEQCRHLRLLADAELDDRRSAGREQARQRRGDGAIGV